MQVVRVYMVIAAAFMSAVFTVPLDPIPQPPANHVETRDALALPLDPIPPPTVGGEGLNLLGKCIWLLEYLC